MTMLKGIPRNIPPQLLYQLACMGHGDTIVLGDANFPADSIGRADPRADVIRCDSMNATELLQAILTLMPIDRYTDTPVAVMQVVPSDQEKGIQTPRVWDEYKRILKDHEHREIELERVERLEFYERAKKAFCVVATGEAALYGNLILTKGVLGPTVVEQINV